MVTQLLVLKVSPLTSTVISLTKGCLAVPIFIEYVGFGIGILMNTTHTRLNFLTYKMGIKLPDRQTHSRVSTSLPINGNKTSNLR